MKYRFTILGCMYGSSRETEIVSVNSNPQAVVDGLMQKMLTVNHSAWPGGKKSKVRKYSWLRIRENHDGGKDQIQS